MKKMNAKKKSRWLIAHLFFVFLIVAGSLVNLILALLTYTLTDSMQLYSAQLFISYFTYILILPGALGSVITGTWLAVRTAWGLTVHYWVMCKWILQVLLIGVIGVFSNILVSENLDVLFSSPTPPLSNPDYLWNRQMMLITSVINALAMVFLVVISIWKPKGKRKKYQEAGAKSAEM